MLRNIVLVIDAERTIRTAMSMWLQTQHPENESILISTVEEAQEILETKRIHAVITDWDVAENGDGEQLVRYLIEIGFDLSRVLICSSRTNREVIPEDINVAFVEKKNIENLKSWCEANIDPYPKTIHSGETERTLLVIDDNDLVRETFKTWVTHTYPELELQEAGSLAEAMECLEGDPRPYAVITDYDLGACTALDVHAAFEEVWGPEKAQQDIVVVSGLTRTDIGLTAINKGNLGDLSIWVEDRFYGARPSEDNISR